MTPEYIYTKQEKKIVSITVVTEQGFIYTFNDLDEYSMTLEVQLYHLGVTGDIHFHSNESTVSVKVE